MDDQELDKVLHQMARIENFNKEHGTSYKLSVSYEYNRDNTMLKKVEEIAEVEDFCCTEE